MCFGTIYAPASASNPGTYNRLKLTSTRVSETTETLSRYSHIFRVSSVG